MEKLQEDLRSLAYHPSFSVISKLLLDQNLTEEIVLIIANRKNIRSKDT